MPPLPTPSSFSRTLHLRNYLGIVGGLGSFIALVITLEYRLLPWFVAVPIFAAIALACFIWKMRITLKGYDLAIAYQKANFCQCIRCGYTLPHKHDPCPECGDTTPAADRDTWWADFIKDASGEADVPPEQTPPDKVPIQTLPIPAELLATRNRNRKRSLLLGLVITAVIIADGVYFKLLPRGLWVLSTFAMGIPVAIYANFSVQYTTAAQAFLHHNLAFCFPCGKPLPHMHAPCPHCGDSTPPEVRNAKWKKLLRRAYLKMPPIPAPPHPATPSPITNP